MIATASRPTTWILLGGLAFLWASCSNEGAPPAPLPDVVAEQLLPTPPPTASGQTATLLPDGRWLLAGGYDDNAPVLALVSAKGETTGEQPVPLAFPRREHSATLLPNGTVLIAGGFSPGDAVVTTPELFDPGTLQLSHPALPGVPARAAHTATLLGDGRVLFAGGLAPSGAALGTATLWDPRTGGQQPVASVMQTPRSGHVAALLPSGRVLLWGGLDATGLPVSTAEVYDPALGRFVPFDEGQETLLTSEITTQPPAVITTNPLAKSVGFPPQGILSVLSSALLAPTSVTTATVTLYGPQGPVNIAVVPAEGGRGILVTPALPLLPSSPHTLFVKGAMTAVGPALPFFALDFVTGSANGMAAASGLPAASQSASVAPAKVGTIVPQTSRGGTASKPTFGFEPLSSDSEVWTPSSANLNHHWYSNLPEVEASAPPQAAPGVTALAGQVRHLDGAPFPGYRMAVGTQMTLTDSQGYFLLQGLPAGGNVLQIDGRTVSTATASYGRYFVHVDLTPGATTTLPYIIWMAKLDPKGTVTIPSPTVQDTVVSAPAIPGLELRLPAGTVIRDHDGAIVTELNITAIPVNQPPFPLPDFTVPVYFTIQPGGSTLEGLSAKFQGAQLVYPNYTKQIPGARAVFWNYDPVELGWFTYGLGTISRDDRQVVPNPGVVIYDLSGAMINDGQAPPPPAGPPCNSTCCGSSPPNPPPPPPPPGSPPPPGCGGSDGTDPSGGGGTCGGGGGGGTDNAAAKCPNDNPSEGGAACPSGGEPVELATGEFTFTEVDLEVQDVFPIRLSRTYRSFDLNTRNFGIGMSLTYDVFQYSADQFQVDAIIMPNGGQVPYTRTTTGNSYSNAVFATSAAGVWAGSQIQWGDPYQGWDLFFRDGRLWHFGIVAPLEYMQDRNGNRLSFTREYGSGSGAYGPITQITTPNGRWVALTNNEDGLITQAQDNAGRTVTYTYDGCSRLTSVTDANGHTHGYVWALPYPYCYEGSSGWLTEIVDAAGTVLTQNTYDADSRVTAQTSYGRARPPCRTRRPRLRRPAGIRELRRRS